MKDRAMLGIALVGVLTLSPLAAADWYVDAASGDDTNAGNSSSDPLATITEAIARATDGDRVLVGPGTYAECWDTGLKRLDVRSTEFDDFGTSDATILDGTGVGCDEGFAVATIDNGSTLNGFTVRNGGYSGVAAFGDAVITHNLITGNVANVVTGSYDGGVGGGIYVYGAATVRDNTLTLNSADYYGGGIYALASAGAADLVIEDNQVLDNDAGLGGGGGYVFSFPFGTAAPAAVITGNEIRGNTADYAGGGVATFVYTYPGQSASVRLAGNTIAGNSVSGYSPPGGAYSLAYGGGIYASTGGLGTETVEIENNTLDANSSLIAGGGASAWARWVENPSFPGTPDHRVRIASNDVTSNTSGDSGGGLDLYLQASATGTTVPSLRLDTERNLVTDNRANGAAGFGGGILALVVADRVTGSGQIDVNLELDEVAGNAAGLAGGGVALEAFADGDADAAAATTASPIVRLRLRNGLIADNATGIGGGNASGGGVHAFADVNGAGDARIEMDRLTLAGNASDLGGAIELEGRATADTAGQVGSVGVEVANSIVADNDGYALGGPPIGSAGNRTDGQSGDLAVAFRYSTAFANTSGVVEDSITALAGYVGQALTVDRDPLLDVDLIPGRCSPTIDAGDPADGVGDEPAYNGGLPNQGDLAGTALAVRSLPDLNDDRLVDGLDLIQITTRFASVPADPVFSAAADLDGDGMIDGDDLALMSADFGLECSP